MSYEMPRGLTFRELMNLGVDHPVPAVVSRIAEVRGLIHRGADPDEAVRITESDPIWNVKIAVVMNLRAKDGPAAIGALSRALDRAGFTPLTDGGPDYADAFEAEDGTEADELPTLIRRKHW
jgi:hypothetical protein